MDTCVKQTTLDAAIVDKLLCLETWWTYMRGYILYECYALLVKHCWGIFQSESCNSCM